MQFLYTLAFSLYQVHPFSRIDTTTTWKKLGFILSDRFDFHMINNLLIAVHAFASRLLILFSVDETLLLKYVNLFASFRELPFSLEMSPFLLKYMYSVLPSLTWRPRKLAACIRLCSRDLAWVGAFARSAMSSALSASVIVCAGYYLLLAFLSVKPYSFIRSINVLSI